METAERAVVLRLGKVIWDTPVGELSQEKLGELFMTGHGHAHIAASPAPPGGPLLNGKPAL
jgi:branched-chain amino acid transport system ATP-binding protein